MSVKYSFVHDCKVNIAIHRPARFVDMPIERASNARCFLSQEHFYFEAACFKIVTKMKWGASNGLSSLLIARATHEW